jgi:branched-chain amino acid transport system ATP-binding protein
MQALLRLDNVTKSFSGIKVVDELSFEVQEHDIIGVIGPNGAGKTTLVNLISGMLQLDSGFIYFKGERIDSLRPFQIVRKGVARSFQIPKPFKNMTVTENLTVPIITVHKGLDSGRIQEILRILDLQKVADLPAGSISVGQQKLLEIGRMFALDPELMMLDEPTAGVHPDLRRMVVQILKGIDKTILMVSHDLNFVKLLCNRAIVLNAGKKVVEGDLSCLKDPLVAEAYLGRK